MILFIQCSLFFFCFFICCFFFKLAW